jgi:hypothetical protein
MLQEVSIKSIVVHQGFTTKILHYTEPAALFFVEELAVDSKVTIFESVKNFQGIVIKSENLLLTTSTVYQNVCFEGDAYQIVEGLEGLQKERLLSNESKELAKILFKKMEDILNESFAGGENPIFVDFG